MKFKLVGKIVESGEEITRTIEAPDEETAHKYAAANGVEVITLHPIAGAASRTRHAKNNRQVKAQINSVVGQLRKYPPYILAMLAATLLYPVVAVLVTFAHILRNHEFHVFAIKEFEIAAVASLMFIQWLTVMFFGFCPYCIAMMALFLMHSLSQSTQSRS